MTVIDVTAAVTAIGGRAAVQDGSVLIEYLYGEDGIPSTRTDGSTALLPHAIRVPVVDGAPVYPVDVPPTDGRCYARVTVAAVKPYAPTPLVLPAVAIPAAGPVEISALVAVDRSSYEPSTDTVTAWELAVTEVADMRMEVELDAGRAVGAAMDAGSYAEATEFDANRAGASAFQAGQSAASALGHRNAAKDSADAAALAAGSITKDVPGGVPSLDVDARVPDARLPERLGQQQLLGTIAAEVQAATTLRDPSAVNAFAPFRTAVANRGLQRVSIAMVGDSMTEGLGLAGLDQRLIRKVRNKLRTAYPLPAAPPNAYEDYYPALYATGTPAIDNLSPAATAGVTSVSSWGFGRRARVLPNTSTTDTITFTLPAVTRFKILVAKNTPSAVMGVTVDGADVTGGSGIALVQTNSGGFVAYDSGEVAAGTRTVVISRVSGGAITVEGILAWHGESQTQGIRVIDSARSGQQMNHFGGAVAWSQSLAAETPDLVVNLLGYNDYLNNVTLTNFQTAAGNVRTAVKNQSTPKTPTVLYVCFPAPRHNPSPAELAPWSTYVQTLKSLAAADADKLSTVLDLSETIPTWEGAYASGYVQSDRIHLTSAGAEWAADAIVTHIRRHLS